MSLIHHNDQLLNIKIPLFNKKVLAINFYWCVYREIELCMTVWKIDKRDVEDWCKLIKTAAILRFNKK